MIMEAYLENKITINSDGVAKKNFIHYRDVCKGLEKVIKDRNALIKSLNESEDPKGNAFTVQEFITFMNSLSPIMIGVGIM